MYQILLTQGDPALAEAALDVLPSASICQGVTTFEFSAAGKVWCFIDWLLEDISGLELCRRIRTEHHSKPVHITIVVDGADQTSRARAIAAGADDYIPGPLTPERLAERLRLYARDFGPTPKLQSSAGLTVDPDAHQARWQGRLIVMRPQELRLLQLFLNHPNRLLPRSKIIGLLSNDTQPVDDRTVDVWVGRLRRRLEAAGATGLIRTVRSMGYVFDTPEI